MNRSSRLQSAKSWLHKEKDQPGNIVRKYKKRYGLDWNCTFKELKMLGIQIEQKYEKAVLQSIKNNPAKKKKVEENKSEIECEFQDDNFAFIAGHTTAGFPYGITWEEWEKLDDSDSL